MKAVASGRIFQKSVLRLQVMSKEKFERKKPHVNVGTIGHVTTARRR
jgi:hypothetical protein